MITTSTDLMLLRHREDLRVAAARDAVLAHRAERTAPQPARREFASRLTERLTQAFATRRLAKAMPIRFS